MIGGMIRSYFGEGAGKIADQALTAFGGTLQS